jgi:flagella basal body P-ring formation protein FlgA
VDPASDRILARDFAANWPALASLPPGTEIGLAPAPGVTRIFGPAELRRLATRFQVSAVPQAGICFERRLAPLDPATLLPAMRRALPGARIEILDYSHSPAPQGVIEFPLSGLNPAPGGGFWNGAVRYAGNRRYLIWARVELGLAAKRVVAREPLKAGDAPDRNLLVETAIDEFPYAGFAASIEEVTGKVLRRPVAAGEAIRTAWLEPPKLVLRGDTVQVQVQRGGARLKLEGLAEASGAVGETIPVLNPVSHRTFRARVAGRGLVSIEEGKS